jgi:peptidyl-tRNA hydrolase
MPNVRQGRVNDGSEYASTRNSVGQFIADYLLLTEITIECGTMNNG